MTTRGIANALKSDDPSSFVSPIAATQGKPIAKIDQRCSCPSGNGTHVINPTCPVHGHGRPAGTGK